MNYIIALIKKAVLQAVNAEREACIRICDENANKLPLSNPGHAALRVTAELLRDRRNA